MPSYCQFNSAGALHQHEAKNHSPLDLDGWKNDLAQVGTIFSHGDTKQDAVNSLGIGKIHAADLQHSIGITAKTDEALFAANLDPHHYNCNDYIHMFILSNDPKELKAYINKCANRPITATDTPEPFLVHNGYHAIDKGPLKQGDIISIHGQNGDHAAVICEDPKTHEFYTMQKPNPADMPVRMSMPQLCQAEAIAQASVQVFRKTP